MPNETKTWPERIYLQHGDSPEVPVFSEVYAADAVTWCMDRIEQADVEYVRADIAAVVLAALDELLRHVDMASGRDIQIGAFQEQRQRARAAIAKALGG